jgi:hypothetical protein
MDAIEPPPASAFFDGQVTFSGEQALIDMLALVLRARVPLFVRAASSSATATAAKIPLFKKYSSPDESLANVGVRWTEAEIEQLVSNVAANEPLEAVALKHKRTVNSIKAKLASLASAAIQADPASEAKVLSKYNVTLADIQNLNEQNALRKSKPKAVAKAPAAKSERAEPAAVDPNAPPRPAMVGKPWTPEHNIELMKQAEARRPIADISALLARTTKSVEMRIAQLSLDKGMSKVKASANRPQIVFMLLLHVLPQRIQ